MTAPAQGRDEEEAGRQLRVGSRPNEEYAGYATDSAGGKSRVDANLVRRANVLSLSRHVPSPAGQTDTRILGARGAKAPSQRTARGRLL